MSHFTVAVLIDEPANLDAVLAPFNEQLDEDSPFLEFVDCTEEVKEEWKRSGNNINPNEKRVQLALGTLKYSTIDQYAKDYYGYNKEGNKYGYYANPNAKWDWYIIGGRWMGCLKLKKQGVGIIGEPGAMTKFNADRNYASGARIKDIDFAGMRRENIKRYEKTYDGLKELTDSSKISNYCFMHGIHFGETKKEYVIRCDNSGALSYAVLDLDGNWHEPGAMGWWGISHATNKGKKDYYVKWHERFIKPLDPDIFIIIVDCHT